MTRLLCNSCLRIFTLSHLTTAKEHVFIVCCCHTAPLFISSVTKKSIIFPSGSFLFFLGAVIYRYNIFLLRIFFLIFHFMYFVKPFQDDATKINYLAELIGTHTKNILLQMLRESFSYEQIIPSLHY